MIELSADELRDRASSTVREWLVTNGLGGFASGTVSGVATRRYHGLLVAALAPPRGRCVLVSHLDETVTLRFLKAPLATHLFPAGVVFPEGYKALEHFSLSPLPTWRWRVGAAVIEKSVSMPHGQNTTVVRYTLVSAPGAVALTVRPFCAFRDFHQHARENPRARIAADVARDRPGAIVIRPYQPLPAVTMIAPGVWSPSPDWWRDFVHEHERERGLDDVEDLFTPGEFVLALAPGESAHVTLTAEQRFTDDPAKLEAREVARLNSLPPEREPDARVKALHVAVDAYRADAARPPALLAGYPWFEDWGRDTLIAFTGCYLVPRRLDEGREVLAAFARYVDHGMLPNRFSDAGGGQADYNSLDAPVWFFHAARRYLQYSGDRRFGREVLWGALHEIARGLFEGTRYGIKVGDDGLLYGGDPTTQLTWMDAKVGDVVFTPRDGAPVEVNALWHAGLRTLAWMARTYGDPDAAARWTADADRARESFRARFWNDSTRFLNDVAKRDGGHDASVRPNALYALALPGDLVPLDQCEAVLTRARDELLVPLGLRTLSPHDPRYRGRYTGDPWSRDSAYHQGTAWPFLLGAYTAALTRTARRKGDPEALRAARREVMALFAPLGDALRAKGLGHLPEVLDGDPPHRHVGCIAQAWSDAEALRALVEDGQGLGPEDEL